MSRNYLFVANYAVMVITDSSKRSAERTLKEYVKHPEQWNYDRSEEV